MSGLRETGVANVMWLFALSVLCVVHAMWLFALSVLCVVRCVWCNFLSASGFVYCYVMCCVLSPVGREVSVLFGLYVLRFVLDELSRQVQHTYTTHN